MTARANDNLIAHLEALIAEVRARGEFGDAKYGKPLQAWDGRNTPRDVREELLDAAVYMTKLMEEREQTAQMLMAAADRIEDLWANDSLVEKLRARAAALRADVPRIGGAG